MTILVTNDAVGALAGSINDSVLTLALGTGQGALFPSPGAGEFFYVTLIRASDGAKEIVRVTARSTDTLTIVRAQDGTTAKSFAASDRVELRPIRAIHENYPQLDKANSYTEMQTFADITITDDLIVGDDASIGGDLTVTGTAILTTATLGGRKVDALNAGVTVPFRQASVPTGWTKVTTWDNAALRIVSGTPSQQATAGKEFTTLLASRTISQANLPAHTHTFSATTSESGTHTHVLSGEVRGENNDSSGTPNRFFRGEGSGGSYTDNNDVQPGGNHTHSISGTTSSIGSGTALDFAVNYVDLYLATKDA